MMHSETIMMTEVNTQRTVLPISDAAFNNRVAMKQAYSKLSFQKRPTVLLTLTVKEPKGDHGNWLVSDELFIQKANLLLRWINAELYGRKFKKKEAGLTGFGCLEKQANQQPHTHLAITTRLAPKTIKKMKNALYQKIKKINLFEADGVDFQVIGGSDSDFWRVGAYIAKEGRMVTLGPDGII